MFGDEIDFEAQTAIPSECEGCGVQCELQAKIGSLLILKHWMEATGENLIGDEGEQFDERIDAQLPDEVADMIKSGIRSNVSSNLEEIDKNLEDTQQEMSANSLSCGGLLKMRAAKDDVTYTVSVCTSPRLYIRDGDPAHLPTHVKAESAKT